MNVYVASATKVWVKAKVRGRERPKYVANEEVEAEVEGRTKKVRLPEEEMSWEEGQDFRGIEDLCDLNQVHEASILESIETRFNSSEKPYTRAGDVVVAVNPYKWIDALYTPAVRKKYQISRPNEAHIYSVSSAAAKGASRGEDQSVLVSGESGAGKTESVKLVLAHLAELASATESTIITQVLRAGPLLESYGNAATSRNGNSSRFAKYLRVEFNQKTMVMMGSWCETALLEKTRVVERAPGERSFHIFYELQTTDLFSFGQLKNTKHDAFGLSSQLTDIATKNAEAARGKPDKEARQEMLNSLKAVCGLDDQDSKELMQSIAAVVCLGRLDFISSSSASVLPEDDNNTTKTRSEEEDDEARLVDEAALTSCAHILLGSDKEDQKKSAGLLLRGFLGRDVRGHEVTLSPDQARAARDALAKELYARIFDHVVDLSNRATTAQARRRGIDDPDEEADRVVIGLLDLFGFEFYPASSKRSNGFEQLLINYANERLQQRFVADVLARAQRELVAEGVPWTKVEYDDNSSVLRLLEGQAGLVDILNEECIRGNSGTDANFVDKLLSFHKGHKQLKVPKIPIKSKTTHALGFYIQHYAGLVLYACDASWVETNRDVLPQRLDACLIAHSITSDKTKKIGTPADIYAAQRRHNTTTLSTLQKRKKQNSKTSSGALSTRETVASKFRTQLRDLMRSIAATRCRYVRCIRPNDNARPMGTAKSFDRLAVVDQLRCCGVLSALRVSRAGYPDRKPVQHFVERYALCGIDPACILKACREKQAADQADFSLQTHSQANDPLALLDDVESTNENAFDDATLLLDPAAVKAATPWRQAALDILTAIDDPRGRKRAKRLKKQTPPFKISERVFIGKTKVFLRDHALDELERLRAVAAFDTAALVQSCARRYIARMSFLQLLASVIKIESFLRQKLAIRRVATLRKRRDAALSIQSIFRGYALRKRGEYRIKRAAVLVIQTQLLRPALARARSAQTKELKAKGRRLDSLQSRLRDLSARQLVVPAASKAGNKKTKSSILLSPTSEANQATVTAAQEVAHDASKALEELRRENALLRDRCAAAEARAESYRSSNAKAKQREAQLLAVVDEARREAKEAHDKRKRAQTSADIAHSGSEAAVGYSRLRQQMLQATNVTPQLRKRILESRRPNRAVTITQQDLNAFKIKMRQDGLQVLKHSTSGRAQRRILKLTDNLHSLYWENPAISGRKAHRPPAKDAIFALAECIELRRATDVDPDSKSSRLQCGTKTLRRSMAAKNAALAFSFIYPSRTIDVQFATPEEAKVTLRYCKALVQQARAKALRDILGEDNDSSRATGDVTIPMTPAFSSSAGKGGFAASNPPLPPNQRADEDDNNFQYGAVSTSPRAF